MTAPTDTSRGWSTPTLPRRGSSSSASSSSLTSSSSFNPHDIPPDSPTGEERRPSALGIRDISRLYRADKKGKARALEQEAAGPIGIDDDPRPSRPPSFSNGSGGAGAGVFAADVNVRGWKIVGGGKWSGDAKVGAYVGELLDSFSWYEEKR